MTADTQDRTSISAETRQRLEGPAGAMTIPRWFPRSGNSPNDRESRQCPRCGGYNVVGDTMCYDCLHEFAASGVLPHDHMVRYAKGMKDTECPAIDLTPIKAMRAKCLDCVGGGWSDVKYCHVIDCPLYPYRLGKRPVFGARPEEMAADRADPQLAAVLFSNDGCDDSWAMTTVGDSVAGRRGSNWDIGRAACASGVLCGQDLSRAAHYSRRGVNLGRAASRTVTALTHSASCRGLTPRIRFVAGGPVHIITHNPAGGDQKGCRS